ncbi:SAM-dependent methyltransferase [Paenibacillus sp. 32O-W]|uniref:SAM-dependent methyltransferase n=1 Tax=Paenibacillus sp. 32O-W TaxID=1695218 RepID=UPI0011A90402|nr:SAM-dependent methyltransferase [Paenibacillus sp. 32O-W]
MPLTEKKIINKIIATFDKDYIAEGLGELQNVDKGIKIIKWLDSEVALVSCEIGFNLIAEHFRIEKPIFIQHIFPVQVYITLHDKSSVLQIAEHVVQVNYLLLDNLSFAIQTRILQPSISDMKKFEVNNLVAQRLINVNPTLILDVKNPQQIVSILSFKNEVYIGISLATSNISNWAGGKRRFAREENQISRAEFKLLEAIEYFNIDLPMVTRSALDLGAAPGGWTRVLVKHGYLVYAVDPAALDERMASNSRVIHIKETSQSFFKSTNLVFDIIVNDMKMDCQDTIKIMGEASNHLSDKGIAIVTLKLKKGDTLKKIISYIELLKRWYIVSGVRHLFHNRLEVTVYLRKK